MSKQARNPYDKALEADESQGFLAPSGAQNVTFLNINPVFKKK
jgi:hypothetical protein